LGFESDCRVLFFSNLLEQHHSYKFIHFFSQLASVVATNQVTGCSRFWQDLAKQLGETPSLMHGSKPKQFRAAGI